VLSNGRTIRIAQSKFEIVNWKSEGSRGSVDELCWGVLR
jgi:hypothetical protein